MHALWSGKTHWTSLWLNSETGCWPKLVFFFLPIRYILTPHCQNETENPEKPVALISQKMSIFYRVNGFPKPPYTCSVVKFNGKGTTQQCKLFKIY